jgi:hypothetical protein
MKINYLKVGEKYQCSVSLFVKPFRILNRNGRIPPFFKTGTPSAKLLASSGSSFGTTQREFEMTEETNVIHRALAAFGAVAMSLAIMVSYFAVPQIQAASVLVA